MAKLTLTNINSGYASTTAQNTNNDLIETALENTVSRDGTTPNQMQADFDMNGYNILNQANPITVSSLNWEGDWSGASTYTIGDAVTHNGTAYVCILASTNNEPPNGTYWQVVAQANFPTQTGNADKPLKTDGTTAAWGSIHADYVDFTHTVSGAVERTVKSRLSDSTSLRDFGAVGDGVTDDTAALRTAFNSGNSIHGITGDVYLCDYATVDTISDVIFSGNGSTIKRLTTSTGGDYGKGAMLNLVACNNVEVHGWVFDCNRAALIAETPGFVTQNHCISVYGNNTVGSSVLNDNGGESKGSKNIKIHHNEFYRTGNANAGVDKEGDGVYCFATDGVIIHDNYFEDMGRWAVAGSDNFNLSIKDNIIDNDTAGTALGSFDIENESADTTNGSYSENIIISRNKCYGRVSMQLQALASVANAAGSTHHIKNVWVEDNYFECTQYATYGVTGINIVATTYSSTHPDYDRIFIRDNVIIGDASTRMDTGINVYCNNSNQSVKDMYITDNVIRGFTDGIEINSPSNPPMQNLRVCNNTVAAEFDSASGNGIYIKGDTFDGCYFNGNTVRDYGALGIYTSRATGTGYFQVNDNLIFDGLATFTGTGILVVNGEVAVVQGNYIDQTGGNDYSLESVVNITDAATNTRTSMAVLASSAAATLTWTNAIPAGSMVVGVTSNVTTAFGTSTGLTSFDLGYAGDTDAWGATNAITLDATTDISDFTITTPLYFTSNTNLVLTANGGNFDATGAIRLVVHYVVLQAPDA